MAQPPLPDMTERASQRVDLPCPNCGDDTPGWYCPTCGQRRTERRISVRRMLAELIEDQLSVNAALPRTVGALLFRPGHLSREYMAGRIARYIPPFRLYLVCSVVFFLLLSVTAQRAQIFRVDTGEVAAADTVLAGERTDTAASAVSSPRDSVLWGRDMKIRTAWPALDSLLAQRLDHFRRMPFQEATEAVGGEILRRAPTAMFLLLPIFAALLKVLYIRRKRYYVEHFVFGLHTHAFAFLLFTLMLLVNVDTVDLVALCWMVVYLYLAMRRCYAQGWFKTLVKYGVLAWTYLMVFTFGVVGLFIAAVLLA